MTYTTIFLNLLSAQNKLCQRLEIFPEDGWISLLPKNQKIIGEPAYFVKTLISE